MIYILFEAKIFKIYVLIDNLPLTEYLFHTQRGCYDHNAYHSTFLEQQSFLHSARCFDSYAAGRKAN